MTTTTQTTKARVLAHIKRNYFVSELTIARALELPVIDVLDALLELERTDEDVVIRDGVIGYIGHTDRVN
jgi:hypothetical protein